MNWKTPKNSSKYHWTAHVAEKMHYYGLSEQKVLGVIRNPKRIETGIVENTVAVMIPVGNIKKGNAKQKWGRPSFASAENSASEHAESWNQEIWVMYQIKSESQKSNDESEIPISKQNEIIKNIKNLPKEKAKKLTKLIPKKLVIISAWRYPGVSPKNNPIPEEIIREIEETVLE